MFAVQPSADRVMVGAVLPVDWVNITPPAPIVAEYLTESAKYASSAVTRLRRSDFIEARYAFSFVLANFGIAIAAKMPMITTTINNSMSVKPLRFMSNPPCRSVSTSHSYRTAWQEHRRPYQCRGGDGGRQRGQEGIESVVTIARMRMTMISSLRVQPLHIRLTLPATQPHAP